MTEAFKNLFEYTLYSRMPVYLHTDEYLESQRVLARLTRGASADLEHLLRELSIEHSMELEAMFQAALSLGFELSRGQGCVDT